LKFTWDEVKNRSNIAKHGIDFETARRVFNDPQLLTEQDREVDDEPRWQTIGTADGIRILLVAHVTFESEEIIHIISARKATPHERRRYAKNH
jgi:uncharacterized DUF497 family protein